MIKLGSVFEQITENVEKYKDAFYKKSFPGKYKAAVEVSESSTRATGFVLKNGGKFLKVTGRFLDIVGTIGIYYDVLSAGSPDQTTIDMVKDATLRKLEKYIQDNNTDQQSNEKANGSKK